jgi:hypothetical protein
MSKSLSITLIAAGISFGNNWMVSGKANFRILAAGAALGLIFDGVEQFSDQAAIGLSTLALITVLLTPVNGHAPAQTLETLVNGKQAIQNG